MLVPLRPHTIQVAANIVYKGPASRDRKIEIKRLSIEMNMQSQVLFGISSASKGHETRVRKMPSTKHRKE